MCSAYAAGYGVSPSTGTIGVGPMRRVPSGGSGTFVLAVDRNSATFREQASLLAEETVPVRNGRVDMKKYRWTPDLDELLWKPTEAWDDEGERVP